MTFIEIIFLAVGLAMDAFAVSVSAALSGLIDNKRAVFRLSFHFGFFQFMMPILGWLAGYRIAALIEHFDHWVAFGLLAFVGGRMIYSALQDDVATHKNDPSRGVSLVMLSTATSIDALAVGFSLAIVQVQIWYPSVIIGLTTAALSLIGIHIGRRLSGRFGKLMELIGGIILFIIGIRILLAHLLYL